MGSETFDFCLFFLIQVQHFAGKEIISYIYAYAFTANPNPNPNPNRNRYPNPNHNHL